MKLEEISQIKQSIKSLKHITDLQEYLVSSPANVEYNKILPILDREEERLSATKIEIDAPAIMIIYPEPKNTLTEIINRELAKLIADEYKIIDYYIQEIDGKILGVIKYTT